MTLINKHLPRILVVDDESTNLKVMRQVLQDSYRLSFARTGKEALALLEIEPIDLILLDIMISDMTGFDVCEQIKKRNEWKAIPIIFVTALRETGDEEKGFELGGVDYIVKPIIPAIVKARIKTHLSLVKMDMLRETQVDLIQRLGRAAEYKDNETGMHVQRMSHYTKILALAAGMSSEQADDLRLAATMHDLGKIGIPDHILLKPNKLLPDELLLMRKHAEIGASILSNPRSPIVALAYVVAISHHERWDGTGYPKGLVGEEIPIEGRIAAIADVFDALTSERPYKKAWPIEKAIAYLQKEAGQQFDPQLVPLFLDELPNILKIKEKFKEWQSIWTHEIS